MTKGERKEFARELRRMIESGTTVSEVEDVYMDLFDVEEPDGLIDFL